MSNKTAEDSNGYGSASITDRQVQGLNWFQRHLNWVIVLAVMVYYVVFNIVYVLVLSGVSEVTDESLYLAYGSSIIVLLAILFPIAGWALKRKNRSLWFLLLFFVPFGWIALLVLENRSGGRVIAKPAESRYSSIATNVTPLIQITQTKNQSPDGLRETTTAMTGGFNYCRNCGNKLIPDNKYCRECGTKIDRDSIQLI